VELKEMVIKFGEIMTQTQLAELLGSSQATISRLKRGCPTDYELGKKIEQLAFKYNLLTIRNDNQQ